MTTLWPAWIRAKLSADRPCTKPCAALCARRALGSRFKRCNRSREQLPGHVQPSLVRKTLERESRLSDRCAPRPRGLQRIRERLWRVLGDLEPNLLDHVNLRRW